MAIWYKYVVGLLSKSCHFIALVQCPKYPYVWSHLITHKFYGCNGCIKVYIQEYGRLWVHQGLSSGGVDAKFAAKRGHYLLIKGSLLFRIESNVLESSGNKYHKPRIFMHIRIAHFAHMTWFAGFKKVGTYFLTQLPWNPQLTGRCLMSVAETCLYLVIKLSNHD